MDDWTPFHHFTSHVDAKHPDQRLTQSRHIYSVILGTSKVIETSAALSHSPPGGGRASAEPHTLHQGGKKNSTDANIV